MPALANRGAWTLVVVGFVALALSFSARALLGLSMPVMEADLGWSRSLLSNGAALALITTALVAPVTGVALDRFGARVLLPVGLAGVGAGMLLLGSAGQPWQFLLVYGGVAAIGFGIVANHVVSTVVARRFEANRGLAVGVATAGSTAGQLLVIPAMAVLLQTAGWRMGYAALGVAALLLALPILWLLRRDAPSSPASRVGGPSAGQHLRTLATSPVFHALFWSFFICGVTTTGVVETHLLPYAAACGFPPLPSATAYGVLSAFNLAGMVAAGWLSDRVNRPLLLASIYVARGLSFFVLMAVTDDIALLFLFAVLFGLFDYSTVPVTASLVASHLGLRTMGLTMGMLAFGHAVGAALGASAGGYLYVAFLRYDAVWLTAAATAIGAGLLVLAVVRERPTAVPATAA